MFQEQNTPTKEIWKDVVGYEGQYEVSNLGNIASLNYRRSGERRLRKLNKDTHNYLQVGLCKEGKSKNYAVHRLVSLAFIPNPENKSCIDHIDGNRTNNYVSNLRWCTNKENSNFPLAIQNISKAQKGKKNKKQTDEHKTDSNKVQKGNSNAYKPNSITQIWLRAKKAGEYSYERIAFNRAYKNSTHKDHQMVLNLIQKYSI